MKRIQGREFLNNEEIHKRYGDFAVKTVNFDLIDPNAVQLRFKWTVEAIQSLRSRGIVTYSMLDIGSHDGILGAMVASMKIDPEDPCSNSPAVDAIESYPPAYNASNELAEVVRGRGFKMDVHKVDFESFVPTRKYDVVTAFEVIEHTKDPMFCIEKIYDLLEIGGHVFLSVPESHGIFGLSDKNPFHMWTATAQSLISTLFYDDRKWHIKQMFEHNNLMHVMAMKRTYME